MRSGRYVPSRRCWRVCRRRCWCSSRCSRCDRTVSWCSAAAHQLRIRVLVRANLWLEVPERRMRLANSTCAVPVADIRGLIPLPGRAASVAGAGQFRVEYIVNELQLFHGCDPFRPFHRASGGAAQSRTRLRRCRYVPSRRGWRVCRCRRWCCSRCSRRDGAIFWPSAAAHQLRIRGRVRANRRFAVPERRMRLANSTCAVVADIRGLIPLPGIAASVAGARQLRADPPFVN